MIKGIAYERNRTRDLLLEYDPNIMPPHPRSAGLRVIYPWENLLDNDLRKQLFDFARDSGYLGTEEEFTINFGSYLQGKGVLFDVFDNFPKVGTADMLYFDLNEKIMYYWDNEYLPINTLPIPDIIINSGTSED